MAPLEDSVPRRCSILPRPLASICALALIGLPMLTASPALAEGGDWTVRTHGFATQTRADALDDGAGLYLGVERRLSERWGIEVGIGRAEVSSTERTDAVILIDPPLMQSVETSLEWTPVTVAAIFRLTPESAVDVYVAPKVGWAFFEPIDIELEFGGGAPFEDGAAAAAPFTEIVGSDVDDRWLAGLRLGLDWPLGSAGWSFSAMAEYTALELETAASETQSFDPWGVGLGVAKRF